MTIVLAIATVSCVSWIITKEALFADLRAWSTGKRGLYPLSCPYCLCPWVAGVVCGVQRVPLVDVIPIVWLSYHSLALFQKVRGL